MGNCHEHFFSVSHCGDGIFYCINMAEWQRRKQNRGYGDVNVTTISKIQYEFWLCCGCRSCCWSLLADVVVADADAVGSVASGIGGQSGVIFLYLSFYFHHALGRHLVGLNEAWDGTGISSNFFFYFFPFISFISFCDLWFSHFSFHISFIYLCSAWLSWQLCFYKLLNFHNCHPTVGQTLLCMEEEEEEEAE